MIIKGLPFTYGDSSVYQSKQLELLAQILQTEFILDKMFFPYVAISMDVLRVWSTHQAFKNGQRFDQPIVSTTLTILTPALHLTLHQFLSHCALTFHLQICKWFLYFSPIRGF